MVQADEPTQTFDSWRIVRDWLPVTALATWLCVQFLLIDTGAEQKALERFALVTAAVVAGLLMVEAWLARQLVGRWIGSRASALVLLLMSVSVWTWCRINDAFIDWYEAAAAAGSADVGHAAFRKSMRTFHWPNYGFAASVETAAKEAALWLAFVAATLLLVLAVRAVARRDWTVPLLATALMAVLATSFAFSDQDHRWDGNAGVGAWPDAYEQLTDGGRRGGMSFALSQYNAVQAGDPATGVTRFSSQHYPPGPMLWYAWLGVVPGRWVLAALVVVLTPALTYVAARAWQLPSATAAVASLLVAVNGELVMQTTLFPAVALVPLAAAGLALVAAAVDERRRLLARVFVAIGLGVVFWMSTWISYALGFWAMAVAAALVLAWCVADRSRTGVVRHVVVAAAAGVTWIALTLTTAWLTGYDGFAAIGHGADGHHTLAGVDEVLHSDRHFYESLGNLGGFLSGHALLVVVALLAVVFGIGRIRERASAWSLGVVSLVFLPVAAWSGFFMLETERVWLFLVPGLAIAAATWAEDLRRDEGRVSLWMLLTSCLLVAVFTEMHFSNHLE